MRLQLTVTHHRRAGLRLLLAALAFARSGAAQAPADHQPEPPPVVPPAEAPTPPSSSTVVRAASDIAEYADTDHVFVFTPGIRVGAESPTQGWHLGGSYLVDVVSAASVDIVSTASRRWEEVRQAGTLDGGYQLGATGVSVSGAVSVEPDYVSLTGGFVVTQDLLQKNLTLLGGYEHGHDVAGRSGTPFSVYSHDVDHDALKAGATVVIDPATIATGIAEIDFERGDSSKPYRYVPMFAPGTAVSVGESIDQVNATRSSIRPLEQLPTSRNRFALTLRMAHRFAASTLRLEERVYDDDWGLFASTSDVRYLVDASRRFELGPHLRVHGQTPVTFWERAYVATSSFNVPALRTGDRELGPLWTATLGGRMRFGLGPAYEPMSWALGLDLNAAYTWYLDDLYLTHRLSAVTSLSLEAQW